MNVHLKTLGCRLNEAELEHWSRQFQQRGYRIVDGAGDADLVVLNSCAVTADAERKSRQHIRRLQRANPQARLIVSGCYASLRAGEAEAALGVDLVVANRDKDRLVALTEERFGLSPRPGITTDGERIFQRHRARAFIKVQDGCRYRCTFCIVTIARGLERSRSEDEILSEINQLHRAGVQEVVLTGVHLGGYGSDNNSNLTRLLQRVLAETTIPRLRLGSLEPWELNDDFFALFSDSRLLPHLHLPLQSGYDGTLRRMARRCRSRDFSDLVGQARREINDLNITTDVIVGFPGETEADWRQSLEFIESIGFGHIHIFPYSARAGTKAADLPGQVATGIKRQRVRQLQNLAERHKQGVWARYSHRCVPVLWEYREPQPQADRWRYWGYTPNFIRVTTLSEHPRSLVNTIAIARLLAAEPGGQGVQAQLSPAVTNDDPTGVQADEKR